MGEEDGESEESCKETRATCRQHSRTIYHCVPVDELGLFKMPSNASDREALKKGHTAVEQVGSQEADRGKRDYQHNHEQHRIRL